jgi:hypothetical protein
MSCKITINGYDLSKSQVRATEYNVSVFRNDKFDFNLKFLLQPSGKDKILPTFALANKMESIPTWMQENLNVISDWIINEKK